MKHKRIESGDKMTKWKPRNKQAGLFLRKAREEFEPPKEYTPRAERPDPDELAAKADEAKRRKIVPVGAKRKGRGKFKPIKNPKYKIPRQLPTPPAP